MDLQGKTVLVAGCGISGIAAADLLCGENVETILYDGNEKLKEEEIRNRLALKSRDCVEIVLGKLTEKVLQQTEILVLSPGISVESPLVETFKKAGIPIIGEIELAYLCGKGKVVGITGTNGKTTTTSLTGKIMENYFKHTFVVGNIGIPYTQRAKEMTKDSVTVAEISSFQLETIDTFCPEVSAILNITPDHMDRHHTMENYIEAKKKITKNQTKAQTCVLNYDNELTRKLAGEIPAKTMFFSRLEKLEEGVCLRDDSIVYCHNNSVTTVCPLSFVQLVGDCNVENVLAATAIALSMGVPADVIAGTIKDFRAVEHRIEFVEEIHGVRYYNDSKGTNPDAAIQGIKAMDRPTVLLAGGFDKKSVYDDWMKECRDKVKALILIGQTKEEIKKTAEKYNIPNVVLKETYEEALEECVNQAETGDAVLLSPACASWGMFDNYQQRGDMFKEYVRKKSNKKNETGL